MAYSLKLYINTFFPHGVDFNYSHIFFPEKQYYQKLDFWSFLHCSFSNNLQVTGYGTIQKGHTGNDKGDAVNGRQGSCATSNGHFNCRFCSSLLKLLDICVQDISLFSNQILPFSSYHVPTFFHIVPGLKHSSLSRQTVMFFN